MPLKITALKNGPLMVEGDLAELELTAASAASKPILVCWPSQKGLFTEPPQRQRNTLGRPAMS